MAIPFEQRNFQKELDRKLEQQQRDGVVPTLLLHSCCAPCSSYVVAYLSDYFRITVFYYNPNITQEEEYRKRVAEQKRFLSEYPARYPVSLIEGDYEPEKFLEGVRGLEQCPEGGDRCTVCYRMRLEKTAQLAARQGFDYFTTTLTISPLKDSVRLNRIGLELEQQYGISYLLSDFKKKDGYKKSVELSKTYELYRQNYCGCVYSR